MSGVPAQNIAVWDPAARMWSPLGSGIVGRPTCFATLANGDLAVGGLLFSAGGKSVSHVARWNGHDWSTFGKGIGPLGDTAVYALAVMPNGDLIAGGTFTQAGTVAARALARWDGSQWSAMGILPSSNAVVRALLVLPNGDLVIGGNFALSNGGPGNCIARLDAQTGQWMSLGTGIPRILGAGTDGVYSLTGLANGDVVAGGFFKTAGGVAVSNIARWNGTEWVPVGLGFDDWVYALQALTNGDVLVCGRFTSTSMYTVQARGAALYRPATDTIASLASGAFVYAVDGIVYGSCVMPNGDFYVGGNFRSNGGRGGAYSVNGIARREASTGAWFGLGTNLTGSVNAALSLPDGSEILGGDFLTTGDVLCNGVARTDGVAVSPLGAGTSAGTSAPVLALCRRPAGGFYAGGSFSAAGGSPASSVAAWDGSSWSPLGGGLGGSAYALATLPSGVLVAAGYFPTADGIPVNHIARWDGTGWSALGTGLGSTA
ncbi:MAG: hypothetical protein K2Q09_04215, partial [Phycisphaerales bacterium]|nr:hypothetical protein [Phycisphaerales bacterium]